MIRPTDPMDAASLVFEVFETEPPRDPEHCPKRIAILAACHNICVAWVAYEELCRRMPHRPLVLVDCGRTIAESWRRTAYREG